MNNVQLVDELCEVSPTLRDARRVHMESFGTLIPHVFMSDVLAQVGLCLAARADAIVAAGGEIAGILEVLERGMGSGDRETRNVISVSFVGDAELEPFFRQLEPLLGPRVRRQLQGK